MGPSPPEEAPGEAEVGSAAPDKAPEPGISRLRIGGIALWIAGIVAGLAVLALVGVTVVRYGAVTGPGRAALVRLLDGLKLGPVGRLHISGLRGDVFGAFQLDHLEIDDAQGAWITADHIAAVWDPGELLARRLHIGRLHAGRVHVIRQPALTKEPSGPAGERPVTLILDDIRAVVESEPAATVQHGVWTVSGKVLLRRSGAIRAIATARSQLHAGDGLDLDFKLGSDGKMHLRAHAEEARGGALAGALGLPADRRLLVRAEGDATRAQGAITAEVNSGADQPLAFVAHWSAAGAQAHGRVDLTASRLTHFIGERLGAHAEVALTIAPQKGVGQKGSPLFLADGRLDAPQGSVTIHGPVDWRRRSAQGTAVVIRLADFSKWLPVPKIGATVLSGAVDGTVDDFTLKGRIDGQNLEQTGVKVARVGGPATIRRLHGEWTIGADLQGEGATAATPVGPLLGPRPRAKLEVSVLRDNRFLIRALDLVGSGVRVVGEGGSALFGRLSFKGQLTVSNLNPIHAGAHGSVTAAWTAADAKGSKVWAVSFDGRGSNFATGLPELDRYLGTQPHLTATGGLGPDGLRVDKADLAGGALQASVKGMLGQHDSLDFTGDWSAKGPFVAGPVEIAGLAKGTGKITGSIGQPRVDLTADIASLDFGRLVVAPAKLNLSLLRGPDGLDGVADLEGATAKYGHASLKTAFRFVGPGIELNDLVADAGGVRLSGALALRNGAPSTADLTVIAGPGAFLTAGKLSGAVKLTDQPGGAMARINLDGHGVLSPDLPTTFRSIRLTASGPLAHLPFQAAFDSIDPIAWSFRGTGVYAGGKETEVTLTGTGTVRKASYATTAPAVIRFGPGGDSVRLAMDIAGGHAAVEATQANGAFAAKANLAKVGLGSLLQDLTGQVSGDLALQGKGPRLDGSADLTLAGARSRDEPAGEALDAHISAVLAGPRIRLVASASNPQGLKSALDVDLPAEASAAPFRIAIDRTKPLKGTFSADGEIRPLWNLFASGEQTLAGRLTARADLSGTLADPAATGQASLAQGRFRDVTTGLSLQNIVLDASFNHTLVNVSRFSGVDPRGGGLTGDGRVSLDRGGASTFTLDAHHFQLIDNDLGRASASGAVTVVRDAQGKVRLTGALTIDRADFAANTPVPTGVAPMDVVEINVPEVEGVERQSRHINAGPTVALDVTLKASRGIFIRGKGLDAELSLDAKVTGNTDAPDLSGVAQVVRGSYDFAGQRFEFENRGTIRLGSSADQIRLDLAATRDDPTLTAVVRVKGTAAKPEITLSSTPVLPQDEVLSRVLFGVSASQLSPAQGAQLASSLASLQGGGGFDVIGNLRQFAGLDRLALGGTQASGTTVSGGKYLTDNVYLELTGGGRTGPTAQVEWRVRRDLSLVSMVGAQGDARLSIRFRKDY